MIKTHKVRGLLGKNSDLAGWCKVSVDVIGCWYIFREDSRVLKIDDETGVDVIDARGIQQQRFMKGAIFMASCWFLAWRLPVVFTVMSDQGFWWFWGYVAFAAVVLIVVLRALLLKKLPYWYGIGGVVPALVGASIGLCRVAAYP